MRFTSSERLWSMRAWPSASCHIENEVSVGLIWYIDRHLDSAIAAGVAIDSCATHDREGESFASTHERSTVEQALACDLSTIEDESDDAEDIAGSGGVSTVRGALPCGVPNFPSSRMIE